MIRDDWLGGESEQRRRCLSDSIYAATAALGEPDAWLSDELADGVDHFLSAEHAYRPLPPAECRELAAKFVRELGQPQLACAMPDTALKALTDSGVLPAHLADAIDRGVLIPLDFDCGDRMVSGAIADGALIPGRVLGALGQAQRQFAHHGHIRKFECRWEQPRRAISAWVRELRDAAEALRFRVVLELNARKHAGDVFHSDASLFVKEPGMDARNAIRNQLLDALLDFRSPYLYVHWHYNRSDLSDADFLRQIAHCSQSTARLSFRPNRGVPAGQGDTLSRVGINLCGHVEAMTTRLGRPPYVDEIVALSMEIVGFVRAYSFARRDRLRANCADPIQRQRIELADTRVVPIGTSAAVCQCEDATWPPEHTRHIHQSLLREFLRQQRASPAMRWDAAPMPTLTPGRRIVELGGLVGRELASNSTAVVFDVPAVGRRMPEWLAAGLRWALETSDIEAVYLAPADRKPAPNHG